MTKAIRELQVEDLSAVVVIDSKGNNLYELGQ
ncbi:fumarate hydratase C-terminal domain-containing protein [Clostridium moutaii]